MNLNSAKLNGRGFARAANGNTWSMRAMGKQFQEHMVAAGPISKLF